ncbi:MAG TPA: DUF1844 domain-containing protein [Terriglobales bacterium]|nr:DUF1844 domain-containing protein [Terriglobales bacterium]
MAEKKQEAFTVTDRRLFTPDGELRSEAAEKQPAPERPAPAPPAKAESQIHEIATGEDTEAPPPPTAEEQKEQHEAYRKSSKDLDTRVELSGHSAKELEMTFERFMASLYMTAMLQLGLMREEGGQPRVDIIGARQTIDTLGLLQEKTKGNLSSAEENFLQNCLYELRMAYVEVTNALARPPATPPQGTGTSGR